MSQEEWADEAEDNAYFEVWGQPAEENESDESHQDAVSGDSEGDADTEEAKEHSERGMQWFSYPSLPNAPIARRGHTATLIPYDTHLTSPRNIDASNQDERRWKRKRREYELEVAHACQLSRQGDKIILFGGNARRRCFNDLHVLDIEYEGKPVLKWTPVIHGVDTSGTLPDPRSHHTATLLGQTMWVFGGAADDGRGRQTLNDLWALNLSDRTWCQVTPLSSVSPAPRHGHTAIGFGSKIIVYGGSDGRTVHDDLWEFDTIQLIWRRINALFGSGLRTSSGTSTETEPQQDRPSARFFHTASYLGAGKVLVYGGRDQEKVFNDLLILDLFRQLWYCVELEGDLDMERRAGHTTSILSTTFFPAFIARLIIYGGWDGRLEDGQEVGAEGDVLLLSVRLDESLGVFTAVRYKCNSVTADAEAPIERDCHTAVLAETVGSLPRLFVFGGTDGGYNYLSDTHVLDLGSMWYLRGGVPSLFKLALRYVTVHPALVWASGRKEVELPDTCLETIAREMLFYASDGGSLISG